MFEVAVKRGSMVASSVVASGDVAWTCIFEVVVLALMGAARVVVVVKLRPRASVVRRVNFIFGIGGV
jgi:hypothetical protein